MVVERSIKDVKVFPELHIITSNATSLADGSDTLFRLKSIDQKNQAVLPIKLGLEQATDVGVTPVVDSVKRDTIHTGQLPGISVDWDVFNAAHPMMLATKFIDVNTENNSGSASTDFRARMLYYVDALDTAKKLGSGIPLSSADLDAIRDLQVLRKQRGLDPIDVERAVEVGIGLPNDFNDFLSLHEVIRGSKWGVLPSSTNLSTTRTEIFNQDVVNKGRDGFTLESLYIERPSQAELGEVTVYISRDEDPDLISFDPACLAGDNTRLDLHIHAFDHLKVEVVKASGTHNSFKASCLVSQRKLGLGFKAKLAEFLGKNNLPNSIEISSAEQEIIDSQMLMQLARSGIVAIG